MWYFSRVTYNESGTTQSDTRVDIALVGDYGDVAIWCL